MSEVFIFIPRQGWNHSSVPLFVFRPEIPKFLNIEISKLPLQGPYFISTQTTFIPHHQNSSLFYFFGKEKDTEIMRVLLHLLFLVIAVICVVGKKVASTVPGGDIQSPAGQTLLGTGPKGSKLYSLSVENSNYDYAPYVLDLTAKTHFDQGYDTGYLMGDAFLENYSSLMVSMLGNDWWEPPVQKLISLFLEWQWKDYMSQQVPKEYMEELAGMTVGGREKGVKGDVGAVAGWGITLANFPGSLENLKYILLDEQAHPKTVLGQEFMQLVGSMNEMYVLEVLHRLMKNFNGFQCSMFGVWGSRTENGKLYSGRNLDWLTDSGISKYKMVTIHHPKDGYAHATLGWAGIWGAITGISSQGLTVHEANLESNDITFRGFPWILRLRHVMTKARNLQQAVDVWMSTNNTVGFNHAIGSAKDHELVCLETMMGNTAVFHANDVREQNFVVDGTNIGVPRSEAVYRTNHGYDPYTIQHYMWNGTNAYKYSIDRYMLFPQMFDDYTASQTTIGYVQAVNIT